MVDGSALVDLSGTPTILLSGDGAQQFAEATLAGRRLGVGEAEFEASLLGDGSMASVPLASRTGQQEYVLWDLTPRGETLFAWLGFVQGIESGGFRPYGGVSVEEVGERLVPLLLWGNTATAVLSDYARGGEDVPAPGGVGNLMLDGRIESLVASPRLGDSSGAARLRPGHAEELLSFPSVSPLGTTGLAAKRSTRRCPGCPPSAPRIPSEPRAAEAPLPRPRTRGRLHRCPRHLWLTFDRRMRWGM